MQHCTISSQRWKDIQPHCAISFQGIPHEITIQDETGGKPWKVTGTEAFCIKDFIRLAMTDRSSSKCHTLTNGDTTFDRQHQLDDYPSPEDGIYINQRIKMTQQLDPELFTKNCRNKQTAVFPFTHGTQLSEAIAQFFIIKAVYATLHNVLTEEVIENYWPPMWIRQN